MSTVGSAIIAASAALAAQPPTEAQLARQIKDLMREPTPANDQENFAARREQVIKLVDQLLEAYPKTKDRDELLMAKLESLYFISIIRTKPLDEVEALADHILAGNPSGDLAAYAASLKVQAKLAAYRAQTRRQSLTTQAQGTTQRALAESQLAARRRQFAIEQYLAYVAKYPKSKHAPPMLAAIIQDAWDRNDQATADKYADMLLRQFPHHVETERIKAAQARRGAIGKPLDISFKSTGGQQIDLQKMKGHVVIVDFWATWCPPCRASIPKLKALYERLKPRGLRVVGISLDSSREKLDEYVRREGMTWPQYFDGKQWENDIARRFGIEAIPAVFVVDKSGILRAISPPDLDALVERLLAEPAK
jgi:thiol-disulfide isomerase/thioredoxin